MSEIDFSNRQALTGVDPQFADRWSPRAFDGSVIDEKVLARIFEAARWSPSCFNEQPWRFYTSTSSSFDDFLTVLVEGNQAWVKTASVIGFVAARQKFARNGKDNAYAEYDCGAAWMALALQCRKEGLYSHGMAGFDKEAAQKLLGLNDSEEKVKMAFCIGRLANLDALDEEKRAKEKPNSRKALNEIWFTK